MGQRDDIDRLIDAVRSLEDRVRALEGEDSVDTSVIGFEIDVEDDFDEGGSEYKKHDHSDRRVPRPCTEQSGVIGSRATIEALWRAVT